MATPRPALPQCRKNTSFATLGAERLEFHDEGGKEGIGLLRHWRWIGLA